MISMIVYYATDLIFYLLGYDKYRGMQKLKTINDMGSNTPGVMALFNNGIIMTRHKQEVFLTKIQWVVAAKEFKLILEEKKL